MNMNPLSAVFNDLRAIMLPFANRLVCTTDTSELLYVNTAVIQENKAPLWFGGVSIKKNYVSYHLMPVYVNPALLDSISPDLKKRMQGKSCFNFKKSDPLLFEELAVLTEKAFDEYAKRGYV